ncbi:MAG: hypothetical protein EH225_02965 [Calditrichaeota bacterium]|nr:MAG: hypothetical protein EH225_02965 [Calditrichota bacterium]
MKNLKLYGIIILILFFLMAGCSGEEDQAVNSLDTASETYFTDIETQMEYFENGGIAFQNINGIFTIGWRNFFRTNVLFGEPAGHAFAVASDRIQNNPPRPLHGGLDMGEIDIVFDNNRVEMIKRDHPLGGTVYMAGPHPGNPPVNPLVFIPNIDYMFEITGSQYFPASDIILHSPAALLEISSHAHGQKIRPDNDLILEWTGGISGTGVVLHVVPLRGNFQNPIGPGNRPGRLLAPLPPLLPHGIIKRLDDNPGQYTFTTDEIQNLIRRSGAEAIVCGVSQWESENVSLNNLRLKTILQNEDRVFLNVD